MKILLKDVVYRNPTKNDARQTFELLIRCDMSEYGEPDSDIEDIQNDWEQIDLAQDAWLAFLPEGDLIGYAAVLPYGDDLSYDFYVDPSWTDAALGGILLDHCETRGNSLIQKGVASTEVVARTFISRVNHRDQQEVKQAGFTLGRYYAQMQVNLSVHLPKPEWPAGVTMRAFLPGQDDRRVHELIQTAFHQPGRSPRSFEDWQAFMMAPNLFDEDLWFLAAAGEVIVGVCLCVAYSDIGWVRQLGVEQDWQRKGIGAALLHHAFNVLKGRGYDKAGLTVVSQRPTSYRFYKKVGMEQARQYDEYVKILTK